ncbi:MAG TPA: glycosyl transferase family protein [Bryobacteraceae bacterium]|jgi:adsorption protein B|nr:glycosyl transferase family protein [Bryobacteraceae bacterium]
MAQCRIGERAALTGELREVSGFSPLTIYAMILDHWVASLLAPLAIWVLINGLDDLIVDFASLASYIQRKFSTGSALRAPTEEELDNVPPRLMAIFVALWKEHRVIQKMIENNVTKLRYQRFEFFVGAYPNDGPTIAAIREAMARFPNVHISICPHDGPTSKADCLNWIYQRMLLFEEERGVRFDMILTHDAEDLMDPDALRWINYYAQWNDMVQIPVLALPTPLSALSHGVYCDEFAEYQMKDMMARQFLGGFIPSNGVGTGFSREALEGLAQTHSNRIFEPACLTEDYENGWRIHNMGMRQKFIPVQIRYGRAIATREYFPLTFGTAVRQRSRWVTGIGLQSWEFHSARETVRQGYWFWRDRKSVIGNLASPLTNLLFLYGVSSWVRATMGHEAWALAAETRRFAPVYAAGLGMQAVQMAIRAGCSARIYGCRFAFFVPLRALVGNWINCFATARAIWGYTKAKLRGEPLRWVKTEHAYPSRASMNGGRRRLREILTGSGWITAAQLESALASRPPGQRLGDYLLSQGLITEADLYEALSLQNNLPLGILNAETVSLPVTRALPSAVSRKWRVLPFRIAAGELHLAGTEVPHDEMHREIMTFTSLEVRFHLITPTEYADLAGRYLA